MSQAGLPDDVCWLLSNYVASALELDVLLAMRGRDEPIGAGELARELRSNETVTAGTLEKFTAIGLLERASERYGYQPKTPRLAQAVDALADSYARKRVRVIRFIYRRPSEGASAFADAFKLRRDEDD
jgi:hypothetical protein